MTNGNMYPPDKPDEEKLAEQEIHAKVAALFEYILEKYAIRIDAVDATWIDASSVSGSQDYLATVKLVTVTKL